MEFMVLCGHYISLNIFVGKLQRFSTHTHIFIAIEKLKFLMKQTRVPLKCRPCV